MAENYTFVSSSSEQTEELAIQFSKKLKRGESVALCGELGAGKTAFVRGLFDGLGGDSSYSVTSPTFALMNAYPLNTGGHLYHFDLYRLENKKQLTQVDFEESLADTAGIVVVEWGDKFDLNFNYRIHFSIIDEHTRGIKIL